MIIEAEDVQVDSGSARKSAVRAPPARSRCVSHSCAASRLSLATSSSKSAPPFSNSALRPSNVQPWSWCSAPGSSRAGGRTSIGPC